MHVLTSVRGERGARLIDGVHIEYVAAPRFLRFPWFSPFRIMRMCRRDRANLALSYGPSPFDPLAALVFRCIGLPFVQVYHADFNQRRFATRALTWLHNAVALRCAAAIVCTNARMAQTLAGRGFGARVIQLVPGVDERFFEAPMTSDGALLFVGALDDGHEYKRLDLLLQAFAEMHAGDRAQRLRVVGDGNRRAHFEQMAQNLGIASAVDFVGSIDDDALAACYAGSGAFVLPSPTAREGFGLVCLEAMAAGLPVVCSIQAGAAAIVREAPGCFVWNGEERADLKRAIDEAREASDETRRSLRAFARRFSWDAMTSSLSVILATQVRAG